MTTTRLGVGPSFILFALILSAACAGSEVGADAAAGTEDAASRVDGGTDSGEVADSGGSSEEDGGTASTPCTENADCGLGELCDHGAGCGSSGVCRQRPASCETTCAQVCGCDGITYDNECVAQRERADVDHAGPCPGFCEPMDAVGTGDSTCPIGHKWTGTDCLLLRGCDGCSGADCDRLMSFEECEAYREACEASSC